MSTLKKSQIDLLAQINSNNPSFTTFPQIYDKLGDAGAKSFADALNKNSNIKTIHLGHHDITHEGAKYIFEVLSKNKSITYIDLTLNKIRDEGAKALARALEENNSIRTVLLNGNEIGDNGAKAFGEMLKKNKALCYFYLNGNQIGDEGAKALGEGLKVNNSVVLLDLGAGNRSNVIGFDGARALGVALEKNTSITSINLGFNNFGDKSAIAIAHSLEQNNTVSTLILSQNSISDIGGKALARLLENNKRISCIVLVYNNIGVGDGVKSIALALERNKSITMLDISSNKIGDEGAKALAAALEKNNIVTEISLGNNNVTGIGTKAIADMLKINKCITSLNLSGNKIGVEGAKEIAEMLKINKNITNLNLSGTEIGDEGTKILTTAVCKQNKTITGIYVNHYPILAEEVANALRTVLEKNKNRRKLFNESVIRGDVKVIREMISEGVDMHSLENGKTVFHLASNAGQWKSVDALLDYHNCKPILTQIVLITYGLEQKCALDEIKTKLSTMPSSPLYDSINKRLSQLENIELDQMPTKNPIQKETTPSPPITVKTLPMTPNPPITVNTLPTSPSQNLPINNNNIPAKTTNTVMSAFVTRICTGIDKENNFNPICIDGPILSFEQSIESAQKDPEFGQVNFMMNIKCAQMFAKQLTSEGDPLQFDEISALQVYTQESPLYRILNERLRDRDRNKVKPFSPLIRLILMALSKLPQEQRTVYRGVKLALWDNFNNNDNKIWWSFTSTTSHLEVLQCEQFLGKTGKRTLFTIEALNAVDISKYSAVISEKELIIPPGATFTVVSKLCTSDDCYLIQLKQQPSVPLILSGNLGTLKSGPPPVVSNNSAQPTEVVHIVSWTVEDVCKHFCSLGATDEILSKIKDGMVDGDALLALTEEEFKELIPPLGIRAKHRKWLSTKKGNI